jgi:uncharacterized protein (TIGR03437 family)
VYGERKGNWWQLGLAVLSIPVLLYAFSEGPPSEHTGGFGEPTCVECHIGSAVNSGQGSVTITVRDSGGASVVSNYASGQSYQITVRVADPQRTTASQSRWGFELSARTQDGQQAGSLTPSNSQTQLLPTFNGVQYISHTTTGTRAGTTLGVNFVFNWTAPNTSAGPIIFHAAGNSANNGGSELSDRIYTKSLTLPPEAVVCTYDIAPASQIFPTSGGTNNVSVTAPSGCDWAAASNSGFVSVTSGSTGTGNGSVGYSVAANTAASARSGTLTIAGQTFGVIQAGTSPPNVFSGGVVNNASFAPDPAPLAPGSIAAIFGSNMNDGSQVPSSGFGADGKLLTTLGAASVKINGFDAPIFYSFASQIGVQIPYELSGQTSASLVLTVAGQSGTPRTIFLGATAPGIFTLNQAGTGQGAILIANSDILVAPVGSISGRISRPAQRGEIITIFCTGLGVVSPSLSTGAQAGANLTPTQATVTIDGLPATVQYSGTAPGFVGLYQVNATVPNGARFANNVTVTVSLGGKISNTATISVGP